jgi:hypothetical protein
MVDTGRPIIDASIDDFFQNSSTGSVESAIGNSFYGINHRQQAASIPSNKDNYGFTFFVRPQLNMQTTNIRNLRQLSPLLTTNPSSYQMITKCLLDPRLLYGYDVDNDILINSSNIVRHECPHVDNTMAFIPILTNNLKSITGFPDFVTPETTTKGGAYREEHSMVDGIVDKYEAYDLEATFRNIKGDPIFALFYAWIRYQSAVFEGTLLPYPDFLVENVIDYNTRIYRVILDPDKKFVVKIACTGASFPTSLPIGGYFDYSSEKPYNDVNSDITIRFRCLGAQYMDDILIYEFNKTVEIFNPSMSSGGIDVEMIKIPELYLSLFNNRGYPRIDPDTYEFSWYIGRELYESKMQSISRFNSTIS